MESKPSLRRNIWKPEWHQDDRKGEFVGDERKAVG